MVKNKTPEILKKRKLYTPDDGFRRFAGLCLGEGLAPQTAVRLAKGETRMYFGSIAKAARALDVSIGDLFEYEINPSE